MNNMQMLMQMLQKGGNPQQLAMNLMQNSQMKNSPMGANLIQLAQNGQTKEIEQIARNIVSQRGGDFDKEFMAFKNSLGLK